MGASNIIRLIEGGDFSVEAHTTSKTLALSDLNKIHTTRGGGAITFTLPGAAGCTGKFVFLWNVSASAMTVTGTSGELVARNNAAANAVAYDQSNEIIGQAFLCVSDGTSWLIGTICGDGVTDSVNP